MIMICYIDIFVVKDLRKFKALLDIFFLMYVIIYLSEQNKIRFIEILTL